MHRGREPEEEEPLKKTVRQDGKRLAAGEGSRRWASCSGDQDGMRYGCSKWGALGTSFFLWPGAGEAGWGALGPHAAVVGDQPHSGVCYLGTILGWGRGWLTEGSLLPVEFVEDKMPQIKPSHYCWHLWASTELECLCPLCQHRRGAASPTLACCCFPTDWGARKTQG